jgi:hypothetical protein
MARNFFEFDETENPDQLHFYECREAIAGFTGGFGNGKTAVLGLAAITVASQYEGARVLVGRATRPKLEDSTKKELLKWVPPDWIARWPSEKRNDLQFKHTGSTIEFRHVRQEGKGKGEEQSNLLSATYDMVCLDQLDDPEFSFKDFADLIGRLRGTARYIGDDDTMPTSGPQFLRFTANPTRNWLFREVVGPYFTWQKSGLITPKLLLNKTTRKPMVQVFNAPSAANKKHTGEAYVDRMEAVFRGSMGSRYISGDWSAYEGLVYPEYDAVKHTVEHGQLHAYIQHGIANDLLGVVEGYDFGQVSPSCYLLAFYNDVGDVLIADGFYEAQMQVPKQAKRIKEIRNKWKIVPTDRIYADPDLFKSKHATRTSVGESIAQLFSDEGIDMQRGASDISAGIEKVSSYLAIDDMHRHPVTHNYGSPRLFVSSLLDWWHNEIVDYYWNRNIAGENVDKPRDTNDHAMDTTKYVLTRRGKVIGSLRRKARTLNPALFTWTEREEVGAHLLPRHR